MKIAYITRKFNKAATKIVEHAEQIINEYMGQGYRLTLRQLYYQYVSRDLIPNKVSEYDRLGSIISLARLAGLIDWDAIEDRTRNLCTEPHWSGPESIINSAAQGFALDKWGTQPHRVEVWIEKEALAGVFERACTSLDVPFFCCRGYTSQSEMWAASQRLIDYAEGGQTPIILHFGDHDPSGIDMTRDIIDRMKTFGCHLEVNRLALNMDQIMLYKPPPNPAKNTDPRFAGYIQQFGDESWELDALEPQVLSGLVTGAINTILDRKSWKKMLVLEEKGRDLLNQTADRWGEVKDFLEGR